MGLDLGLVPKGNTTVYDNICKGLGRNYRTALTSLVPLFEDGCREYIRSKGIYPVIRKGGKDTEITLNEMFINSQFRKVLDDLLGDELVQEIEYLTCRPLGVRLRNKIAHKGLGDDTKFLDVEAILFYFLVRAYYLAYNKKS